MPDRRYPNNSDKRRVNIDDDYIELVSDNEYEDIFSDSNNDVYIGKKNNNDVYFDRGSVNRNNVNRYEDEYIDISSNRVPRRRVEPEETVYTRQQAPVRRNAPPPSANRRPVNYKGDTQRIPRVNSDEVSDYEARRKRLPSANQRKKKSKGFVAFIVILCIIIGFGGILAVMANSVVGKFNKAEDIVHIDDVSSLVSESHVHNILLIGTDAEKGGSARSDSMMIASVNKQTGRITVCSILRDTHLYVPGHQESKVNAAYAWGGANLLIQTIEYNFGIKIDDYAAVDFEMFTALVDGLGGIEVDVTEDEADYINNRHRYGKEEKPEAVSSGENVHLTGYQALWYVRIRKLDSDFNRTERQRKVIGAIMEDVKSNINPIGIFTLMGTAQDVAPFVTTTLSMVDFWSLAFSLMGCMTKSGGNMDKLLVTQKIPFDDTWWYSDQWDGSSISIDLETNKQMLYDLLYTDYQVEETSEDASEAY